MGLKRILPICPGCGRREQRHAARGLCGRCISRERRKDPEKWERELQHRRDRRQVRKEANYHDRPPDLRVRLSSPRGSDHCKGCGLPLLDPDDVCGFCLHELPPTDKLRIMELIPGQDEEWARYFSLLSNHELIDLISQANRERARRVQAHARDVILPKMTDLYRRDGHGNLVGTPAHHARCPTCNELLVNCKGHTDVAA